MNTASVFNLTRTALFRGAAHAALVMLTLHPLWPAAAATEGSTDKQPSWQLQNGNPPPPGFDQNLLAVSALDGGTAWVAGAHNALYYSHDGGRSWSPQTTGAPAAARWKSIHFISRTKGFVAGKHESDGLLYGTHDGGKTWTELLALPGTAFNDLVFADSLTGWLVGQAGVVYTTTDGGDTWVSQDAGTENDLTAVSFLDRLRGLAVGAQGTVVRTDDGGSTWHLGVSITPHTLRDVAFQAADFALAVGDRGVILRSTDGGQSWQRQTAPTQGANVLGVDFVSRSHGRVVLNSGVLLKTGDAGRTWRRVHHHMGQLPALHAIDFPSKSRGWIVGNTGTVAKYTALGASSPSNQVDLFVQSGESATTTPPSPSSFSFELTDYSLTEAQSYDGWTAAYDAKTGGYTITFYADRENSSGPAAWFNEWCNQIVLGTYGGIKPDDLNFAFNGTLIAGGSYSIAFGQGHNAVDNDWWVGSPTFQAINIGPQYLQTPDGWWRIGAGAGAYNFNMFWQP